MEYLSKLFGSPARVKTLRLFLFNPSKVFDRDEVARITRITPDTASKELSGLARAGIINRKTFLKEIIQASGVVKKRKTIGWVVDQKYPHIKTLTTFMLESLTVSDLDIQKRFRGSGGIKLLVLSGSFVDDRESLLDILIVGDRLKESIIKSVILSLEAEYGKEIRYMVLSVEEFHYRRRVRDKFVRDVIDFPHKEIVNQIMRE